MLLKQKGLIAERTIGIQLNNRILKSFYTQKYLGLLTFPLPSLPLPLCFTSRDRERFATLKFGFSSLILSK